MGGVDTSGAAAADVTGVLSAGWDADVVSFFVGVTLQPEKLPEGAKAAFGVDCFLDVVSVWSCAPSTLILARRCSGQSNIYLEE